MLDKRRYMGSLKAVALSRLSGRKDFICTGYAISLHLHMNGLMKQSSGLVRPPFLSLKFSLVTDSSVKESLCNHDHML